MTASRLLAALSFATWAGCYRASPELPSSSEPHTAEIMATPDALTLHIAGE